MATLLTHRIIALTRFYMMAKFQGNSLLTSKVMTENVTKLFSILFANKRPIEALTRMLFSGHRWFVCEE